MTAKSAVVAINLKNTAKFVLLAPLEEHKIKDVPIVETLLKKVKCVAGDVLQRLNEQNKRQSIYNRNIIFNMNHIHDLPYKLRYLRCSSIYKMSLVEIVEYWRRSSAVTEINEGGCPPPITRIIARSNL